jgi:hypothetical protein
VFVGIDVSKDRLDVHVRPLGVGFSVSNEAAGYAALIARLRPRSGLDGGEHGAMLSRVGRTSTPLPSNTVARAEEPRLARDCFADTRNDNLS